MNIRFIPALLLACSLQAQTVLVKPYVQSGDGSKLGATDVKVIAWMTDQTEGRFSVEYGATASFGKTTEPERRKLDIGEDHYFLYSAKLKELPLDADVHYRVSLQGKAVRQASFHTRKPASQTVRFITVGDTGDGKADQKKVAFQMSKVDPEFLVIVGDIVYSDGRLSQYEKNFWPVYNEDGKASPASGAPMMQSIPFYGVLGNHDVKAGDLAKMNDGFAAFYFFHPPLNGPKGLKSFTDIKGKKPQQAAFKAAAGTTYPGLCFYSFDDGPAHFLCLDSNPYVDVSDPALQKWIKDDLSGSQAKWKFAFFHHPGFNASAKHATEQRMRLLAPLFESAGVDIVFAGHVHNYQRSKPLKFVPGEPDGSKVDGKFTLDEKFDGKTATKPDGVLYIVTGGGGASLYDPDYTDSPDKWKNGGMQFTTKMVSDRHSFSLVEASPTKVVVRQIDENGKEVDRIAVTK